MTETQRINKTTVLKMIGPDSFSLKKPGRYVEHSQSRM